MRRYTLTTALFTYMGLCYIYLLSFVLTDDFFILDYDVTTVLAYVSDIGAVCYFRLSNYVACKNETLM